jgi:hypothetical protein
MNPCKVERISRKVIQRKLLTELSNDESKVAILATQEDIEDMIFALESYNWNRLRKQRCGQLASGLRQLLKEAFPGAIFSRDYSGR